MVLCEQYIQVHHLQNYGECLLGMDKIDGCYREYQDMWYDFLKYNLDKLVQQLWVLIEMVKQLLYYEVQLIYL